MLWSDGTASVKAQRQSGFREIKGIQPGWRTECIYLGAGGGDNGEGTSKGGGYRRRQKPVQAEL